ncbi:MAG: YARHG domain-containing protein [Aulosira sp. DedQUE10]|nr:YARHG domain-containing protein [Aulosira sp. DedQUE10]
MNLLNDRYQVICTLGAGGFGETFLAEDSYMPSKRRCVVKQLRPIQNNPQIYQLVQERFQREAAILEELGGATDQIPTLYAYFEISGQFYLVQEWVEGDTITAKLQQQGLFSEHAVQELLLHLLPVLEYVHGKYIVHRDIKPDNIIVRHRDGKPVLIDFGAVRESMGTVVNSQGNPKSSIVIGTPGYMSSEQAAGRPVYSSDLYSIGMTAIYLLTGRQPQQIETDPQTADIMWRQYANHISTMMADILDKAIAYHPRDRFPTARAMLDALQSIANPIPPTQPFFHQSPVVTVPPSPTIPVTPRPTEPPKTEPPRIENSNRNGLVMGGLIAGGLIGAAIIISQVLPKDSPTALNQSTPSLTSPSPTASASNTPIPQQTQVYNTQPSAFYFLSDSAYAKLPAANLQVKALQSQGYSQAGSFWIPNYPNLSDQQLFAVYVSQFSDRNSCIDKLKSYGQDHPNAYCAFASKNVNVSADRFYFKQIAGTSTPDTTPSTTPVSNATATDYSWLSQRPVTDADLQGKDALELDIMRNWMFAVHGRRFDTPGIQDYFNQQPWYKPTHSAKDFPSKLLSPLERRNVDYIAKYQDRYNLRYFKK